MRITAISRPKHTLLLSLAVLLATGGRAFGHCDGLDGPVVTAARNALDSNQLERILIWVPGGQEDIVRDAFLRTQSVRKLGGEAKSLADLYFFETVVRIHRTAEGAPFTGLKPAGRDLGPVIPAADKALQTGKLEPLSQRIERDVRLGLREAFEEVRKRSQFPAQDIAKGREYVSRYVDYIHYVQRLHEATARPSHGHFAEAPP